jgi:hypothetical protein
MSPRFSDNATALYDGYGTMYSVSRDGKFTPTWRVNGWYAFDVFVSNDGRSLVRIGNGPIGDAPSKSDLAVAFYNNGNLTKQYSTDDLVLKKSLVSVTISHYVWLADENAYPMKLQDLEFSLTTIDGMQYVFNVKTGEIEKRVKVADKK